MNRFFGLLFRLWLGEAVRLLGCAARRSVAQPQAERSEGGAATARSEREPRARGAIVFRVYREWLRGCAGVLALWLRARFIAVARRLRFGCSFSLRERLRGRGVTAGNCQSRTS